MNTGGLAQMSSNNFASHNGMGNPLGGLASRRGGQNLKPLSFDTIKNSDNKENALPTPRTSRSHLLAGLRTAPKTSTATSFGPQSPTTTAPSQQFARRNHPSNVRGAAQDGLYNAPKTAYPQYGAGVQQNAYQTMMNQHYTVDQVLAPPELGMDEQLQEQMDPNLYAQLVATNMYLAEQQQRLQQQLRSVQAAAQQFQQLSLNSNAGINPQVAQQQMAIYEQQQQQLLRNYQQQLGAQAAVAQAQAQVQAQVQAQGQAQQFYYNPATGQYYVDTSASAQMMSPYAEQPMTPGGFQNFQQQHYQKYQQQAPRVQVSPPPENSHTGSGRQSPPKRQEPQADVTPLPPPSANAFRRGHKKASSLAPLNAALAAASGSGEVPLSAGPRTSQFPMTPGGYGPGQARAGEHPIRQPRGPPSMDELKTKPTAKFEGSKNFATRTRRSAVHNLVRAGLERRKGTGSSAGSMSPVSETAEESSTPITDNDSDSGRSGSGSLVGEEECSNSRKLPSSSWGAIGSNRPGSRQMGRKNSDSEISGNESDNSSFAHVFKNGAPGSAKAAQEASAGQRRAPRLVLTSAEKRKTLN